MYHVILCRPARSSFRPVCDYMLASRMNWKKKTLVGIHAFSRIRRIGVIAVPNLGL